MRADVLTSGFGVTSAQATDIARRIISTDNAVLDNNGEIRLSEPLHDILHRLKRQAPHLFAAPEASAYGVPVRTTKAGLRAMNASDRLGHANDMVGVLADLSGQDQEQADG